MKLNLELSSFILIDPIFEDDTVKTGAEGKHLQLLVKI